MTDTRELKACPCGKIPTSLAITDAGQGGKWARVSGVCCGEWNVEFRTGYEDFGSEKCTELAKEAWNEAPRKAIAAFEVKDETI